MILPPSEESKAEPDASGPAAGESHAMPVCSAFPSTVFRELTMRSLAATRLEHRSTKAFPATAFRAPVLWAVALQLIER